MVAFCPPVSPPPIMGAASPAQAPIPWALAIIVLGFGAPATVVLLHRSLIGMERGWRSLLSVLLVTGLLCLIGSEVLSSAVYYPYLSELDRWYEKQVSVLSRAGCAATSVYETYKGLQRQGAGTLVSANILLAVGIVAAVIVIGCAVIHRLTIYRMRQREGNAPD